MEDKKNKIYMKIKKEIVLYLIFGVATTFVNILTYYILETIYSIPYLIANATAWFSSVLFAFITNKMFVFKSNNKTDCDFKQREKQNGTSLFSTKKSRFSIVLKEMGKFFSARIATGVFDMVGMWLSVTIFLFPEMITKVVVNVIVILLNYVLSKWVVFR